MPLTDLQERIREGVRKELPFALLNRCIERHEHVGFRTDCSCDYCEAKRAGTRRIRFTTQDLQRAFHGIQRDSRHMMDREDCRVLLSIARRDKVRALRKELREMEQAGWLEPTPSKKSYPSVTFAAPVPLAPVSVSSCMDQPPLGAAE